MAVGCFVDRDRALRCADDLSTHLRLSLVVREQPDEDGWYWVECLDNPTLAGAGYGVWQAAYVQGVLSTIQQTMRG